MLSHICNPCSSRKGSNSGESEKEGGWVSKHTWGDGWARCRHCYFALYEQSYSVYLNCCSCLFFSLHIYKVCFTNRYLMHDKGFQEHSGLPKVTAQQMPLALQLCLSDRYLGIRHKIRIEPLIEFLKTKDFYQRR